MLDSVNMRLLYMYSIVPQGINGIEIRAKHVRVLVVFGVDVLADRGGERQLRRPSKRQRENVARPEDISPRSLRCGCPLLSYLESMIARLSPSRGGLVRFFGSFVVLLS